MSKSNLRNWSGLKNSMRWNTNGITEMSESFKAENLGH